MFFSFKMLHTHTHTHTEKKQTTNHKPHANVKFQFQETFLYLKYGKQLPFKYFLPGVCTC